MVRKPEISACSPYIPNNSRGIAPTTAAVMHVAKNPSNNAFHTSPMISFRRSGIRMPLLETATAQLP